MWRRKFHRHTGFTLIELLVVIALVALLSSIVYAVLSSSRAKARDAIRLSDVKQIQLALSLYNEANAGYPDSLSGLTPLYFSRLPKNPGSSDDYVYDNLYIDGEVVSECSGSYGCNYYFLGAHLEQANQVLAKDKDLDPVPGGLYDGVSGALNCEVSAATLSQDRCYDVAP